MRPPRSLLINLAVLLGSAALALLAGELAVRAFDLFAGARAAVGEPGLEEPAAATPASDEPVTQALVHPFVAWTHRPGLSAMGQQANVFGLVSPYDDYRTIPAADFTVGIFGGSVAKALAVLGGDTIVDELSKPGLEPSGRIRVLNFSTGGYKQPQQLMLLSEMIVLGVPLDVVVNFDGFNEVALSENGARAGYHPVLPSVWHWAGALDLTSGRLSRQEIVMIADVERLRRRQATLRGLVQDGSVLGSLELARALAGALALRAGKRAVEIEQELQDRSRKEKESTIARIPDPCLAQRNACWPLIADIWQRSSVAMKALSEDVGATYVHILQPNQYVEGSKDLTQEERATAYRRRSHWSRAVRRGYPHLQERAAQLRDRGVAFYDLTGIFQEEERTLYIDECCHVNKLGNQILGQATGRIIREALLGKSTR